MVGNGLFKRAIRDQVENGGEGFLVNHLQVMTRRDEAGPDITTAGILRPAQGLAAVENIAAFLAHLRQGGLHILNRAGIHQRTHKRARFERIADTDLPVGVGQPPGQGVPQGLMHDDPAGGRAALAGGADRAE